MTRPFLVVTSFMLISLGAGCVGTLSRSATSNGSHTPQAIIFPATVNEAGWKTMINHELGFSLRYPSNWKPQESAEIPLVGLAGVFQKQPKITIMTSTNTVIDASWSKAKLPNGTVVTYSVDEEFIHLYHIHRERVVILSARANAPEEMHILSTYQPINPE